MQIRHHGLDADFHLLLLDGVYIERPNGSLRFRWVKAPTSTELAGLTQTLARRIGRYLERQGLLERDAENSYLAGDDLEAGPMEQLLGSSITYRIAAGPQQGRKVFTLQTLPPVTSPSMTEWAGSPASPCTPVSRRGRINARSSSGCVGISAGLRGLPTRHLGPQWRSRLHTIDNGPRESCRPGRCRHRSRRRCPAERGVGTLVPGDGLI
jgi:hypothetical protein